MRVGLWSVGILGGLMVTSASAGGRLVVEELPSRVVLFEHGRSGRSGWVPPGLRDRLENAHDRVRRWRGDRDGGPPPWAKGRRRERSHRHPPLDPPRPPRRHARRRPAPPADPGQWRSPLPSGSYQITSTFGWRRGRHHDGVDLAATPGTWVRSVGRGEVTYAGWRSGYGWTVEVAHPNGWTTRYAHLRRRPAREVGDRVVTGTRLGEVGSSGNATGSHLHLEVLDGHREALDPARVLPACVLDPLA